MKLLSRQEAQSKKKTENDALVGANIRLRTYYKSITDKLNDLKDNYEPDKLEKLRQFEQWCKDLETKKQVLLKEYAGWAKLVEEKKEIYYGFIEKSDALQEQKYKIDEEHKKLKLREAFVIDLEEKWRSKQ